MAVKSCLNPACEFHRGCPARLAEAMPSKRRAAGENRAAPQDGRKDQRRGPVEFMVRIGFGLVGILWVNGAIENDVAADLAGVEEELPTLAGLMVIYACPGGTFRAGYLLERLTLVAKQTMPVVAYVRSALSTAIIPALAADVTLGAPDCTCGCFGNIRVFCSGSAPQVITNSQSPLKFEGGTPPWPPESVGDEGDLDRLRAVADRVAEDDIRLIAGYCARPVEHLRPFLDGRVLDADEALAAGLINRVCNEDEAYEKLLKLIQKKKGKQL